MSRLVVKVIELTSVMEQVKTRETGATVSKKRGATCVQEAWSYVCPRGVELRVSKRRGATCVQEAWSYV